MNATEWRQYLGELVREGARSYEENHYYEVPISLAIAAREPAEYLGEHRDSR